MIIVIKKLYNVFLKNVTMYVQKVFKTWFFNVHNVFENCRICIKKYFTCR